LVNELYAKVFANLYGIEMIGLRYFNIFGPKQSPNGPYAAVIPLFINALLKDQSPVIFGDGQTSRDFTYVDNAVQANLLALFTEDKTAINEVYNIACGEQTSLTELFEILKKISGSKINVRYEAERRGDVKHSLASIEKAKEKLGYDPKISVGEGLLKTFHWNKENSKINA
jgi:UDP-N-acetylglucosamine 4-epimerase